MAVKVAWIFRLCIIATLLLIYVGITGQQNFLRSLVALVLGLLCLSSELILAVFEILRCRPCLVESRCCWLWFLPGIFLWLDKPSYLLGGPGYPASTSWLSRQSRSHGHAVVRVCNVVALSSNIFRAICFCGSCVYWHFLFCVCLLLVSYWFSLFCVIALCTRLGVGCSWRLLGLVLEDGLGGGHCCLRAFLPLVPLCM